ncbi:hypothetical protein HDU90_003895 [Geranomyces variabilis]|nr:hypothetical protein HDU90_003895 [Geranomyces variabilis]
MPGHKLMLVNGGQDVYKLTGLTFPDDKGRKLAGWAAESPPPLHSGYGETLKLAGFTFRDGRGCKLACWLLQNELYTGPADLLTAEQTRKEYRLQRISDKVKRDPKTHRFVKPNSAFVLDG